MKKIIEWFSAWLWKWEHSGAFARARRVTPAELEPHYQRVHRNLYQDAGLQE